MSLSCINTNSKEFREAQVRHHLSSGTLAGIVSEYQNNPSLWEEGHPEFPSDAYISKYFNRTHWASEQEYQIWKAMYTNPRFASTREDAINLGSKAAELFGQQAISIYQTDKGTWVMKVSRPLVRGTVQSAQDRLAKLQSTVDSIVNNGALYRGSIRNNSVALNSLGRIEDNFERKYGTKVKAYWDKTKKKYIVRYADKRDTDLYEVLDDFSWNEEQQAAIDGVSKIINDNLAHRGNTQFVTIQGKAGTGKTTIIDAILASLNIPSYSFPTVAISALSHKAESVLYGKIGDAAKSKFNIDHKSIAGLLGMRESMQKVNGEYVSVFTPVKSNTPALVETAQIIFVDEASMVNEEALELIKEKMRPDATVVFIGDKGQLPPVRKSPYYTTHQVSQEADSPVFTDKQMPKFSLVTRVRQGEDSPVLAFADRYYGFTMGEEKTYPTNETYPNSADNRLIIQGPDVNVLQQLLPLFEEAKRTNNPNLVKIVAYRNATVDNYNKALHFALHPEADRNAPPTFMAGDLVMFTDNYVQDMKVLYPNSQEASVVETSAIRTDGSGVQYTSVTLKMADGSMGSVDVVVDSPTNKAAYNRILEQLKQEALKTKNWRPFYSYKEQYASLGFSYAITAHKSQGSTYDVVVVDAADIESVVPITARQKSQAIYTAMTRASNITIMRDSKTRNAAPTVNIAEVNAKLNEQKNPKITPAYISPEVAAQLSANASELAQLVSQVTMTTTKNSLLNPIDVNNYSFRFDVEPGTKMSALNVVALIAEHSKNPAYKALAKAYLPLLKDSEFIIQFDTEANQELLHGSPAGRRFGKPINGVNMAINLNSPKARFQADKVVLHEITHELTVEALKRSPELSDALDEIISYIDDYISNDKTANFPDSTYRGGRIPHDIYALLNKAEFVAEFMSNLELQEMLRHIPAKNITANETSVFQMFMNWVAKAFNSLMGNNTSLFDQLAPVMATLVAQDERAFSFDEVTPETKALVEAINQKVEVPKIPVEKQEEAPITPKKTYQVTKVVSGMQTGMDQIGLEVARELGITTGGIAPRGWITEDGVSQNVGQMYGLTEDTKVAPEASNSDKYVSRTEQNAMSADGTIYFAVDASKSAGIHATRRGAQKGKKAGYMLVLEAKDTLDKKAAVNRVVEYLKRNNINTLNIAGSRRSAMNAVAAQYPNLAEDFADILRAALKQLEQVEKPEALIARQDSFSLTTESAEGTPYNSVVSISALQDVTSTREQKKDHITRMLNSGELQVSTLIKADNLSKEDKKVLDSMENQGIHKTADGNYTVGLREDELKRIDELNNLLGSNLFRNTELRHLAKMAVFKLSESVTLLQTDPRANKVFFGNKFEGEDFTKMSRIEIINKIGLSTLLEQTVKEPIFNTKKNTEPADNDDEIAEKMDAIYDNFDAFIRLGYDALIGMEEISFADRSAVIKSDKDGINAEDGTIDEKTEQEIQEISGSSAESWQVGFRQVSAFSSLSQLIKRNLDKLYQLNPDGTQVVNDYGLAESIDSSEAVAKILKWTQYAESLDDKDAQGNYLPTSMVGMLREHMNSEPWLRQIVGSYHPGGDTEATEVMGLLLRENNEQFKAQFFSNFKKYFQKYTITFQGRGKNAGKTLMKVINEDTFVDSVLRDLNDRAASKEMGNLKIWDNNTQTLHAANLNRLNEIQQLLQKAEILDSNVASLIKEAYDLLDIETPEVNQIQGLFAANPTGVKTFARQLQMLLRTLGNSKITNPEEYSPINKATQSDYKKLIGMLSPIMGDNIEAVSYEAGKLYYGYITPSYLGKLIGKIQGHTADYNRFMSEEYKQYEGMFYNTGSEDTRKTAGPAGWLNYWLEKLNAPGEQGKQARQKLEHVVSLSYDGVGYTDKTPAQYMASMVAMYLYDDSGNSAYYRIPTMSNKPSEEYIKFDRISEGFEDKITSILAERTFYQELNRIRAVRQRKETLSEDRKIKSFDSFKKGDSYKTGNGEKFQFLDYLNDYLEAYKAGKTSDPRYELGQLLNKLIENTQAFDPTITYEDGTVGEANRFTSLLKEAIQRELNERFEKFLLNCAESGFITLNAEGNPISVFEIGNRVGADVTTIKRKLREFFWNDHFASINILQLTVGDIAYYKDTEDLQKRLAQLHAPGMRGNIGAIDTWNNQKATDGKERTIYIADSIVKSDIISNLELVHERLLKEPRFQNNPAAKAMMSKQLKEIIKAFEEVNFADAQGYSSPTSYRKKMMVFGKWDQRQEDAYNRILRGEFSDEDLTVAWQPLKPFVYTQIQKNGHSDFMPKLKVGVQNKNSEYLLIIADALMRSQGIDSRLSAIYDAMEESQGLKKDANGKWSGTPNMRGIDTIQFESTVKAGLTGVIDINHLNKEQILDVFRKAAAVDAQGNYNPDYVHELPFEDYSLQQEVPAHFRDHTQGHGSQDRILTITDMPNTNAAGEVNYVTVYEENNSGKRVANRISVEEAKQRYYDAITQNIKDSVAEVMKRFNLNSQNEKMRNIALSRMLQQEIIKDARFGTDLLWACSVNKNGEFNIPLSDPIQSNRIQQLLNSIIKNNINKQEIAGGPVVQVSNFGTSEDLIIRFQSTDGKLLLSEAEFNNLNEKQPEGYDSKFAKADGETDYKTYRDKHQSSVAYFECYVPIYDENIVRDFGRPDGSIDIKAMEKNNPRLLEMIGYRIPTESKYSMVPIKIKGFLPRAAGEGVMLPKEITTLSGSDFDIDKLYIMRYSFRRFEVRDKDAFKSEIAENTGLSKSYVGSLVDGKLSEEESLGEETNKKIQDAWKNYTKMKAYYRSQSEGRKANDNYIVATQWAILTSPQVQEQLFTPGNFDEPKRVGYLIAAMDNTGMSYEELKDLSTGRLKDLCYTKKSLLYADTQMQFHRQNMVAGKLIGVFAQANVSHGFMSLPGDASLSIPEGSDFTINGYRVADQVPLDQEFSLDGVTRVSNILASYLAASVDAVKDPILNLMNINMDTANVATTLVRLGFSVETVGWFLTHPAIVDLIQTYDAANVSGRKSMEEVLSEKMTELVDNYGTALMTNFNFTDEFFIKNHKRVGSDATELQKTNQANNDYNVLALFGKVLEASLALRSIVHMTRYNSITAAVGPFASNTMVMKIQDKDFDSNRFITDSVRRAADNPILKSFRESAYALEKELLGKNIIQASPIFEETFNMLYNKLGYMSQNVASKFSNFFMSYYVNMDKSVFDLSYENRKYMIDEFPMEFIGIKSSHPDNLFLQSIKLNEDKAGNKVLELKTRGMKSEQVQDIINSWADLYSQDPALAIKLVEYNFFRGSFGFNPLTFMSLVPNSVKARLPNYIENLERRRTLTPEESERMINQFMLNTGIINLGTHEMSDLVIQSESEDGEMLIIDKESLTKAKGAVSGVTMIISKDDLGNEVKQYYIVEPSQTDRKNSLVLTKANKLGGNNQGFEIDPTVDIPQTVWEDTQAEEAPSNPNEDAVSREEPKETKTNYQRVLEALFNKEGELQSLVDGTAVDEVRLFAERLNEENSKDFTFGDSPLAGIAPEIISQMQKIIEDTDLVSLTAQQAQETIKKLNLCQ